MAVLAVDAVDDDAPLLEAKPGRSLLKRARRRERRLASRAWDAVPGFWADLADAEAVMRAILYEGEAACAWADPSGLALRAPLSAARRLARHFERPGAGLSPCGLITLEVPSLPPVPAGLSRSGLRLLEEPNAGGSSEASEAWAFEALRIALRARLVATEMELSYLGDAFPGLCGSQGRTDFAVELPHTGEVVGVSVTRAYAYRREFQASDARALLCKKLGRIVTSTRGCVGPWAWARQLLFVWARSVLDAQVLRAVFEEEEGALAAAKSDTLVVVAVCPAAQLFRRNPC